MVSDLEYFEERAETETRKAEMAEGELRLVRLAFAAMYRERVRQLRAVNAFTAAGDRSAITNLAA